MLYPSPVHDLNTLSTPAPLTYLTPPYLLDFVSLSPFLDAFPVALHHLGVVSLFCVSMVLIHWWSWHPAYPCMGCLTTFVHASFSWSSVRSGTASCYVLLLACSSASRGKPEVDRTLNETMKQCAPTTLSNAIPGAPEDPAPAFENIKANWADNTG